jgi:hypothetical protein
MSISVKLDLPEHVLEKARREGLLEPGRMAGLIERELALSEPLRAFREMVERMRAYPDEPVALEEIQGEVNAVRAQRRDRGC